jgi:8-oxo-dGTP diphosphatase
MNVKERYKIIPEVFLLIVQDGKILLGLRANTGWMDGMYGLPAGHGEDRETMREGALREGFEEIGITIDPAGAPLVLVQHRWCEDPGNGHARVGFYFAPTKWQGDIRNAEPEKCARVEFFPIEQLPSNTVPHVRAAVEAYRRGEHYNEFEWDTMK